MRLPDLRPKRAELILDRYEFLTGNPARSEQISDLVSDIGHFCVENDLAYLHLLANGISHWRIEMTDPDCLVMPQVTITVDGESAS